MVTKISLLKISAAASLLEYEHTAQDFIIAANAVFIKAQGLVMLAPLHEMAFGLLEELLDNWHLLNLDSMEWRHKAEVHQSTHASSFRVVPSGTGESPCHAAPCNKGKGKAKVTEEDEDEEGEATQKLRKELEDFVVLTKGFKGKGKAKALLVDSEPMGTNDSNKKEEEERVCVIKKIKRKHIEELIGMGKGKEIIEFEDLVDETMAPKTPAVEPLHQTLKSMILISSMLKSVPKPIIALASPVASPSTA
ncbi:hypothetical protein C0995_004600 [Termitomyces sp. Mi166|nr:hypothetical protein C0995_004600 [Termitomyces sp. Mi166\